MSWAELQNRRLQVRFLSHLPVDPEFMGIAALVVPAHNVCGAPNVIPPGATPQVHEYGPLGDGLSGPAAGSSRLPYWMATW